MMSSYYVHPGDTLARIAYRLYGDWHKYEVLAAYNGIRPRDLQVGPLFLPPWEPRKFRYPLDQKNTRYLRFGSIHSAGRWAGLPHPGVDFHQRKGAPVYAIGEGVVDRVGYDEHGYGWYIVVQHVRASGRRGRSLYAHLAPETGRPRAGDLLEDVDHQIGTEGCSGATNIPHLHFEWKETSELGLYGMLPEGLNRYWKDPYQVIGSEKFVPVSAW